MVASNIYISACNDHVDNCLYVLLSNNIVQILEFLLNRLNVRVSFCNALLTSSNGLNIIENFYSSILVDNAE